MTYDFKPLARRSNLVVQDINEEVLIYDLSENKAFCLNSTAAMVWQLCDGRRTIAEISEQIGNEDYVWLALDILKKENLIENEFASKFSALSRREVIKKIGLGAAAALPVINSLVVPTSVYAASCINPGGFPTATGVVGNHPSSVQCRRQLENQCCRDAVTNYSFNTIFNNCDGYCA